MAVDPAHDRWSSYRSNALGESDALLGNAGSGLSSRLWKATITAYEGLCLVSAIGDWQLVTGSGALRPVTTRPCLDIGGTQADGKWLSKDAYDALDVAINRHPRESESEAWKGLICVQAETSAMRDRPPVFRWPRSSWGRIKLGGLSQVFPGIPRYYAGFPQATAPSGLTEPRPMATLSNISSESNISCQG